MNSVRSNRVLFFAQMGIGNLTNFAGFINRYPDMTLVISDRHPCLSEFIACFYANPVFKTDAVRLFDWDLCIMPPLPQRRDDIGLIKKIPHRIGLVLDERPKFRKKFNHVIKIDYSINEIETCKMLCDYVDRNFTVQQL